MWRSRTFAQQRTFPAGHGYNYQGYHTCVPMTKLVYIFVKIFLRMIKITGLGGGRFFITLGANGRRVTFLKLFMCPNFPHFFVIFDLPLTK